MTISRTYQWFRHATNDANASPAAISGATSLSYTTALADVGLYIHVRETATNQFGSASANSNVVGPIAAAGETYTPAPGTIAPLEGTAFGARPLSPRILKRTEQAQYDAEILAMRPLCDLARNSGNYTISLTSGRWSDPSMWSNGVPTAGMSAHIDSGHTVVYDVESSAQLKYVIVDEGATLKWDPTRDTKLVCDTVHACPSAYFEIGTKISPIPESGTPGKPRVDIVFIGAAPGASVKLGLMTMGKVTMHGARKADKIDLSVDPTVGATTLTAANGADISGWQVGDTICVLSRDYTGFGPDPQYAGPTHYAVRHPNGNANYNYDPNNFKQSHDEIRTITAISGQVITLSAALTYAHPTRTTAQALLKTSNVGTPGFSAGAHVSIPPRVTNLSRSIRFSSGGAPLSDNQKRGHIMFMACDQIDVRFAEAKNLARTDTNPTLWIPNPKWDARYPYVNDDSTVFTDSTLTTDLGDPNNVRGRYAWHLHEAGLFGDGARLNRNMSVWEGLTAWAPQAEVPIPGWAITHHASRLAIHNCVVYNVRGAGIVSELGSEIGQWMNNTVSWCRGDGWGPLWCERQRQQPNHHGHSGHAYENQARNVLQINNEFTSARCGWVYEIQTQLDDHGFGPGHAADHQSLRTFNPINGANGGWDMPDRDTYGKAAAQIPDLTGCVGVDFEQFFRVDHRVEVLRGDPTAMIAVGWKAYGGNVIVQMDNYTYKYFFKDFAFFGGQGGAVTFIGTRTSIFGWMNGIVEGFSALVGGGSQANFGPGWIDIATNLTGTNDSNPNGGAIKSSSNFANIQPSWSIKTGVNDYNISLLPGNGAEIRFTGTMVDGYSPGGRHWPEFQEPSYDGNNNIIDVPPTDGNPGYAVIYSNDLRGWSLVERNGVYQNNGQWYMPAYYSTVDWSTFKPYVIRLDHPLTGAWDSAFLAQHTITPTPPVLPLPPEDINKPFPAISPPANATAPFIYGAPVNGLVIECDPGVWSAKPNDCDFPQFDWYRNGAPIAGAIGRTYTLTNADVGQAITCAVAMFNSGGKSQVVTTAAVTPRAAPTAPDPATIFGANLKDYFLADDPDSSIDIYAKSAKAPGVANTSFRGMQSWIGNLMPGGTLTQLDTFGSNANVQPHGWLVDNSRAINFEPWRNSAAARHWTNFGAGTEPAHVWAVVQRSPNAQQQVNGPIIKAFGHQTYVSTETAQNLLYNDAGGVERTLTSSFPKSGMGVIYHARNSQGCLAGFNNVITTVSSNLASFDREFNIGYNGAFFAVKALYWVSADTVTSQQYADIQAYLASRYGF